MALPTNQGIEWRNLVNNANVTVSVPWTYPAAGVPGATGAPQSGTATFTFAANAADQETAELMNLLTRALRDGRATVA